MDCLCKSDELHSGEKNNSTFLVFCCSSLPHQVGNTRFVQSLRPKAKTCGDIKQRICQKMLRLSAQTTEQSVK